MNIKFINVDMLDAYEVIRKNIYDCKTISKPVIDTKFHHRIGMENVSKALENGLLSERKLAELEGRTLIQETTPNKTKDNVDSVSLSRKKRDFSINADIIVSKKVKAKRNKYNYFNEVLVENEILPELFNAVDFRILDIFDFEFHDETKNTEENRIKLMIKYYNYLREIALVIKQNNLDIPLREVSDEVITLDPQKVIRLPYLHLKELN